MPSDRVDVNALDNDGRTPLHFATLHNTSEASPEIAELLLQYGADASIKDNFGKTAFEYAMENPAYENHPVLARLQTESGITLN
ncbi:MAG: ankyrin repeat domain-containing protein [Parvularculales bacterium]